MAEDRRTILKVITGVLGTGAAGLVGVPTLGAFLAPIRRDTVSGAEGFIAVADPAALPDDGSPLAAAVVVERPRDAWVELPPTQVGNVFLRRDPSGSASGVVAFSTICPHLGCQVDYRAEERRFACPC